MTAPIFLTVGHNDARAFGMAADARALALALKAGCVAANGRTGPSADQSMVVADLDYAYDPAWLATIVKRPGTILLHQGRPVLAHVPTGRDAQNVICTMAGGKIWDGAGYELLDADTAEVSYHELRKRDRPFVLPLIKGEEEIVERAAYDASYKGVTDLLTLYLWRHAAFYLTRWAARFGLTPIFITLTGAIFCLIAFWQFWQGHYWIGMATGLLFMVLDTVDGKLARCTGQSSKWGNIFDHGVDLVHPPFWWWAWYEGLDNFGKPLAEGMVAPVMGVIMLGYLLQRLIEGIFMRRYLMHIHVWQQIDSQFRLITARRNPNMVILFVLMLIARPDWGLIAIAVWTLLSLLFHTVRLGQAAAQSARGEPIRSWLA